MKGTCGCGARGELFGGSCLECVSSGRASQRDRLDRARHQDIDERTESLRRKYRSHGNYAASPHHMTAAERRSLPRTAYALPDRNPPALPLRSLRPGSARGYITAASGRLEMMKNLGHLKPGEYQQASRLILAAARREGIHSHFEPR